MRRIQLIAMFALVGTIAADARALSFNFSFIDDASGTFASRGWLDSNSLFQRNIRTAADLWAARIDSNATIVVDVDPHSFSARAGGTNSLGRFLYTRAGKNVWEFGPLTRILTGKNSGETTYGYDILLGFDAEFVEDFYWFDPQPELRSAPVPTNKGDFMSVVLHEMGHGFGFTGFRNFFTGQISGSTATQFDDRSYFGGNGNAIAPDGSRNPMFFRGDHAASVYGSDVHLTNKPPGDRNFGQNYFHFSDCTGDGLEGTLMNGCVLPNGERLEITPFDVAVLADLGYPIVEASADYNGDGTVDAADYVVWRESLGELGVGLAGDGNLDNRVDETDFTLWRAEFTNAAPNSSGSAWTNALAAPEPDAATLLFFGCVLIRAIPRRASRRARARALHPMCLRVGRSGVHSSNW
jgi:hypothetical protein